MANMVGKQFMFMTLLLGVSTTTTTTHAADSYTNFAKQQKPQVFSNNIPQENEQRDFYQQTNENHPFGVSDHSLRAPPTPVPVFNSYQNQYPKYTPTKQERYQNNYATFQQQAMNRNKFDQKEATKEEEEESNPSTSQQYEAATTKNNQNANTNHQFYNHNNYQEENKKATTKSDSKFDQYQQQQQHENNQYNSDNVFETDEALNDFFDKNSQQPYNNNNNNEQQNQKNYNFQAEGENYNQEKQTKSSKSYTNADLDAFNFQEDTEEEPQKKIPAKTFGDMSNTKNTRFGFDAETNKYDKEDELFNNQQTLQGDAFSGVRYEHIPGTGGQYRQVTNNKNEYVEGLYSNNP